MVARDQACVTRRPEGVCATGVAAKAARLASTAAAIAGLSARRANGDFITRAYRVLREAAAASILPTVTDSAAVIGRARAALAAGRPLAAFAMLEPLTATARDDATAWQLFAFAARDLQRLTESLDAFRRAVALAPGDARGVLGYAETTYACGLPAEDLYRRALVLAPGNLHAIRGFALAQAAAGRVGDAEQTLLTTLANRPDWLEGHKCLATLRSTRGDATDFAASYRHACALRPADPALRLAWFGAIAQTRDWEAARAILAAGEAASGAHAGFLSARLFMACETHDDATAEQLFACIPPGSDLVRDIAWLRFCLRTGRPEAATVLAEQLVRTRAAPAVWPYLSLLWRLRGDPRAGWLDGDPPRVHTVDLGFSAAELEQLGGLLRRLHTSRAPHLEQSVRGGTQTDGQLLFRQEPVIRRLRARLEAAIADYAARLPATVVGHPLLGTPRDGPVLFAGSWSVRLRASGYHVSHTHPQGWLSSALYVALPGPALGGAAPAGWIRFGAAPPELGVNLPAYAEVEPRPGRLVLFPSTMWHGTVPFDDGERLVIAFDVALPRAADAR